MGVEAAFFGPIKYAILPDLFGAGRIAASAMRSSRAGTFFAILLGPIAGMLDRDRPW